MEPLFATLAQDFVDETKPMLVEVGTLLLTLEETWQSQGDAQETLRRLRSGLHTIKGNAAMMGIVPMERLAHALEDLCALVSDCPETRDAAHVQMFINGSDLLAQGLDAVLVGDVPRAPAEMFVEGVARTVREAEESRSARVVVQPLPAGESGAVDPILAVGGRPLGEIASGSARISDQDVDGLLELAGETIVGHTELARLCGRLSRGQFEAEDLVRMDDLLSDLGRRARQMRHDLLRVRLAPIAPLFQRFTRYVRDLAQERGLPIALVIEGGETAVDRAIIGRLFEPLLHIVRNAIAHGVEPLAERAAAGKPAIAKIFLRACLREGRVNVYIADDGRGLDRFAIMRKAQSMGLDTSKLEERELARLIFQPGFSTAKEISSLAGRGVGLDVVARAVQALGGNLDVRTVAGQGTLFILDLPVTVSLQRALIFGVDSETFAVPVGYVMDALATHGKDMQTIGQVLLIHWRQEFVPCADAGRLLGCQDLVQSWTRPYAIVLQTGNKRGALLVDWLSEVQEIVVKPLDESLSTCRLVGGVAVLGQGRVVPILDCIDVVRRMQSVSSPSCSPGEATTGSEGHGL